MWQQWAVEMNLQRPINYTLTRSPHMECKNGPRVEETTYFSLQTDKQGVNSTSM